MLSVRVADVYDLLRLGNYTGCDLAGLLQVNTMITQIKVFFPKLNILFKTIITTVMQWMNVYLECLMGSSNISLNSVFHG